MSQRIHGKSEHLCTVSCDSGPVSDFFVSLGLTDDEAETIHRKLNADYGLSVRGAAEHYGVNPLEFDSKCDAALPLEELLTPDPKTQSLLAEIDRSKVRVWALTNAYRTVSSVHSSWITTAF